MITYLAYKTDKTGAKALHIISKKEWIAILRHNKTLPLAQRRFFIKEVAILEDEPDILFIEVSLAKYRQWNSQNTMRLRNQAKAQEYKFLSLDALSHNKMLHPLHDCLAAHFSSENEMIQQTLMADLRSALKKWQPWAEELLDIYLAKQGRSCTKSMAAKYGVSEVTMRKYKKEFVDFIKIFLN